MDNKILEDIWMAQDEKLDRILKINQEMAIELSKKKLNNQISKLYLPKIFSLTIGVPYTLIIIAIASIAFFAEAYMVGVGVGIIAIIMILTLCTYFHQVYLVGQVKKEEDILSTQQQLSSLRISSYRSLNLAIFQVPFWSVCWVSITAVKESPIVYGGVNLFVFILLTALSIWMYRKLSVNNKNSKMRDFFLSGNEWEPIIKSSLILEEIKEYEK